MFRQVLLSLSVLVFSVGLAQAQAIRGKVLIPSVQTPDRIEVLLEKTDGQVIVRAFTDNQGNFEMRGMPIGGYEIVVRVEGYQEARLRVDVLPANQGATIVNIPIDTKPTQTVILPGEPIIDVAELNRNYPKNVLQEYEKGIEDNRKGETARAIGRLEEVVKLAPDFYSAHSFLGNLYQKLDRFRDAEKEYKTAAELNPRSAQPLTSLGSLYIQEAEAPSTGTRRLRGRILDDALDALDDAIKLDGHSAAAYYLLGVAYYKSSFLEEAETNLNRALDLDAHAGSTRLMLVNLYVRQEKWQSALDHLDAYLKDNPKGANRAQLEGTRIKLMERVKN
jgi:cytochrome c-type biogenesis protein CcmH/NrfG